MNKKISVNLAVAIAIIAMTVTFSVTMLLSMRMFDKTVSSVREKEIMYNKLAEIDKSVRAGYYGEINEDTLNDMLGAAYMAGIGDKYAQYYSAKQYTDWKEIQSGKVIGIGVDIVRDTSGYARITRVYTDSPAGQAGLAKNQFITRIGDTDVRTLSLTQTRSLLRGEAGTSVSLTVLDQATGTEQPLEIQHSQYDRPTVFWEVPEGKNVGYVQITTFGENTATELTAAAEAMLALETPVQALVIDVRGNDGGSLDYAMDTIDALCPVGPIASRQNKDGTTKLLDTSDNKEIDLPVAVLVNGSTAAGAELFATSVRDFGKGRIVGTTTAGKGMIVCDPEAKSDGSAIAYSIATLLTKNGESFEGTGVKPDVEVILTTDEEANLYNFTVDSDPQIIKAFEATASLLNKQQNAAASESASGGTPESAPADSSAGTVPADSQILPESTSNAE